MNLRAAEFNHCGIPGMSSGMGACVRNWHAASNLGEKKCVKPFDDAFGDVLKCGGEALSLDMGRMWLEDVMTLSPDEEVTMLVSPSHHFLTGKTKREMYAIGMSVEAMCCMMISAPLSPIQIGKKVYFALKMKVRSNPHCQDFKNNTYERSETSRILKVESGAGVTFSVPAVGADSRGYVHTFTCFFMNLLVDPLDLMFWKHDYHAGPRISSIKKTLDKMSNHVRMHALVNVYRDYVYGDRLQYYAIYAHLMAQIARKESKVEVENYKNVPISDARMKKVMCLKASDPNLKVFIKTVNNVCKGCIDSLYGHFSVYASPIIPQDKLNEFVVWFKKLLPMQYKTLTYLLGKEGNDRRTMKHKWLWDRYCLNLFFVALRIRNNNNLTW